MLVVRERADADASAFENHCPHAGGILWFPPVPGGQVLTCKAHGATFRPGDGLCVSGPCEGARLTPLPVRSCEASGGLITTIEALEGLRDAGSGGKKPPAGWTPNAAAAALLERFGC